MTVAAVILSASPDGAVAGADGVPSVRRIADVAWSGGATPVVVVSFDPTGEVAQALAGASVTLAEPAPLERGPAAQMTRGIEVALAEVHDTDGVLIWPADAALRDPRRFRDEPGWPVLLPFAGLEILRNLAPDRMPPSIIDDLVAAGIADRRVDLGDPGVIHDRETARADLPPYIGPGEPVVGHVHEWGAAAAEAVDEGPLEGPALAPYEPAGEPAD